MPIDLTHWPASSDVQQLLTAAGFWPSSVGEQTAAMTEIGIAIPATVAGFEKLTGWLPFLAGAADTVRKFAATDEVGLLALNGGLVSVTSLVVAGQNYIQDSDFWLRRSNAEAVVYPYDQIQFAGRVLGDSRLQPDPIAITGRWGYCTTLPADVWEAVRQGAGALAVLNLTTASQAVIRTVTEDTFRQSFDLGLRRPDRIQEWLEKFSAVVQHYTRVVV